MLSLPLLLAGCSETDDPALEGFPKNSILLSVAESEEASLVYKVGYDREGEPEVTSEPGKTLEELFSQTFEVEIKAAAVSPERMTVQLEPYALNIPVEAVELDTREAVIEAGYNSATVTVRYTGSDCSFIESTLDAQTFEFGVRIAGVDGYRVGFWTPEAKVVADKAAYESVLSLDAAEGLDVAFKRTQKEGAIVEDPVSYTFRAVLNRPAFEDVTVSFETLGLDAAFAAGASFSPAKVTIPAGSTSSEEVTWTVMNDFLMTTDWIETHDLAIKSTCQTEDDRVVVSEKASQIAVHVLKGVQAFEFVAEKDGSWSLLDNTGWSVESQNGWVEIDMLEPKDIAGFGVRYRKGWSGFYDARTVTISISEDGKSWTEIGTERELPRGQVQYFKLDELRSLRYVRIDMSDPGSWQISLDSIEVYTTE